MKKRNVMAAAAAVVFGVGMTSCGGGVSTNANLKSDVDSVAYAIGVNVGAGFSENLKTLPGEPLDKDLVIAGFVEALKGGETKIKAENATQIIQTYMMSAQIKEGEKNKKAGEEFLAENKTKAGVITTESGLQYQVVTEGKGDKPTAEDKVKVHYTGTLLDGTKFDSSVDRGEPASFGVTQVIKGWTEGLQLMPVGSKYIFWIPSDLAYGEQGAGQAIKPGSTLKFEVELLEIEK